MTTHPRPAVPVDAASADLADFVRHAINANRLGGDALAQAHRNVAALQVGSAMLLSLNAGGPLDHLEVVDVGDGTLQLVCVQPRTARGEHGPCGEHLCDVESGDTLGTLVRVAVHHDCPAGPHA